MMTDELDVAARVAAGVDLLNERVPDWREHVDPDTLDLAGVFGCVLGQLAGHIAEKDRYGLTAGYYGSLYALELPLNKAPDYGFEAHHAGTELEDDEYAALEKEWQRVLS